MSDIIIVPAPTPTPEPEIGWMCCEYHGFEIYKKPDAILTPRQLLDNREWPRKTNGEPVFHKKIMDKDGIKVGDKIIVKANPFDYIYDLAEVVLFDKEEGLWASTCGMICPLEFGVDDRNCWVSGGVVNLAALKVMKATLE